MDNKVWRRRKISEKIEEKKMEKDKSERQGQKGE